MQYSSIHSEDIDNGPYQRRMAGQLLKTMSINEAVQYCLENGWEGALRFILHTAPSGPDRRSSE